MDKPQLEFVGRMGVPRETILEYIDSAFKRELPFFIPAEAREGSVVICASGPSLRDNLDAIRKHKEEGRAIVAVKGAHDFLIENGITPDYATGLDPAYQEPFKKKNLQTIYFIASQTNPKVFDDLAGCQVVMWHSMLDADLSIFRGHYPIWGGSTSGLRTIALFYYAGLREMWLYGFDGSFAAGERRVDPGERNKEPARTIEVECDGRRFRTCPEMAKQVHELQEGILPNLRDLKLHWEGDGLMQHAMRAWERLPEEVRFAPKAA